MARSTLDDFVIKEKLGSGSYGAVYRAQRKVDRQPYALKEVDLQGMTRKEQEDCIKETQILSALDCEYIIKYYDSFLEKGKLYLCMEYAAAGNLHDFIKRQPGKLPEQLIWRLFIQMLLGLHHMHSRKVLHRDMKTLNVFLDQNLNVKLGDLGVARVLSSKTNFAKTVIGTPYYLSPEMCEDKPYNQKSDCWALGVCLYECCTQRQPFDAENQGALILKILRGKYPAVQGYSKELIDVVKACLTLDHRKRPATTSLLAFKAVRDWADELGMELPPMATAAKPAMIGIPPPAAAPGALGGSGAAGRKPAADGNTRPGLSPCRSVKEHNLPKTPDSSGLSPSRCASVRERAKTPDNLAPLSLSPSRSVKERAKTPEHGAGRSLSPNRSVKERAKTPDSMAAAGVEGSAVRLSPRGIPAERRGSGSRPTSAAAKAGDDLYVQRSSGSFNGPDSGLTPPASDRCHHMREALPALRNSITELVGPRAFDALHMLVNMMADADLQEGGAAGSEALVRGVERIITDKSKTAAVLPLIVKLMYLEAHCSVDS